MKFDENGKVIYLEEKQENPKTKYASQLIYFYYNTVVEKVKLLKPFARGELEITDLNRLYIEEVTLKVNIFGMGNRLLEYMNAYLMLQA